MHDWPSAPRTGYSFQICSSSVRFPHCLGQRGSVQTELPFRFLSLWGSLLIPSHAPYFPTQPLQLFIPCPAVTSESPSPLDPCPQVGNMLPVTSSEKPFSFLLVCPHPPRSLTIHLLERAQPFPQSHLLASDGWPCLLTPHTGVPWSLPRPSGGCSENMRLIMRTKWELISSVLETFFSLGFYFWHSILFPRPGSLSLISVCHLLRDLTSLPEPTMASIQRSKWLSSSISRLEISPINQQVPGQTHLPWPHWTLLLTNCVSSPPPANFLNLRLCNYHELLCCPITNHLTKFCLILCNPWCFYQHLSYHIKATLSLLLASATLVEITSSDSRLPNFSAPCDPWDHPTSLSNKPVQRELPKVQPSFCHCSLLPQPILSAK